MAQDLLKPVKSWEYENDIESRLSDVHGCSLRNSFRTNAKHKTDTRAAKGNEAPARNGAESRVDYYSAATGNDQGSPAQKARSRDHETENIVNEESAAADFFMP